MSVVVDVIKDGYSRVGINSETMIANCTCTLVKESKNIVLIDTLTAWDSHFLIEELEKRNLKPQNITHVVATHGHSDHIGNLNLFTHAVHIIGQSVSYKDEYQLSHFKEDKPYRISENIEIIPTPGHTLSDVSVIVKNTVDGTIAITGDLFERESDIENPELWRTVAGSEDPESQGKYRSKILEIANYVVPGHGPKFKVTEGLICMHEKSKLKYMCGNT